MTTEPDRAKPPDTLGTARESARRTGWLSWLLVTAAPAAVGLVGGLAAILDFPWGASPLVQNVLLTTSHLAPELLAGSALAAAVAYGRWKGGVEPDRFRRLLRQPLGIAGVATLAVLLLTVEVERLRDLRFRLGPESVLVLAQKGRYEHAAERAHHVAHQEAWSAHAELLIGVEVRLRSLAVLSEEFERSLATDSYLSPDERAATERFAELLEPE